MLLATMALIVACGGSGADRAATDPAMDPATRPSDATTAVPDRGGAELPPTVRLDREILLERPARALWAGDGLAVVESPRQVAFFDADLAPTGRVWFGSPDQAALLASGWVGDGVGVISGTGVGDENDLVSVTPGGVSSERLPTGEYRLFPADGTASVWATVAGATVGIARVDETGAVGEVVPVEGVRFLLRAGESDGTVWVTAPEDALLVGIDVASGDEVARVALPGPNVTVAAVTPDAVWLESRAAGSLYRYSTAEGELSRIDVEVEALADVPAVRSGVVRLDGDRMAAVVYHDDGTEPVLVLTTLDTATGEVGPVRTVGAAPFAMVALAGDLFVLHEGRRLASVDVDDLVDGSRDDAGVALGSPPPWTAPAGAETDLVAAFEAVYGPDSDRSAAAAAMEDGPTLLETRASALDALAAAGVVDVVADATWADGDLGWVEWSGLDRRGAMVVTARRALFEQTEDGWVARRDDLCAQFLQVGVVCP